MHRILLICAAVIALAGGAARAGEGYVTHAYDGSFEDAVFSVENAIIGAGLVVDYVSHTGEMLARTGADVGSDVQLFDNAQIFVFCSASLSRKVMEEDPMNIAWCPYTIFVTDRGGEVLVGYREYPEGAMQQVEALLAAIVDEAVAF